MVNFEAIIQQSLNLYRRQNELLKQLLLRYNFVIKGFCIKITITGTILIELYNWLYLALLYFV